MTRWAWERCVDMQICREVLHHRQGLLVALAVFFGALEGGSREALTAACMHAMHAEVVGRLDDAPIGCAPAV